MKAKLLLTSLIVAGCGDLISNPGNDFRVDVAQSEITFAQRVLPYDLEFTVGGCGDFDANVVVPGGSSTRLEPKPLGHGRFTASVPVEALRLPDPECYDADHPRQIGATLEVTCREGNRQARVNFSVRDVPAWRATRRDRGPLEAVFASASTDHFYEIGSGWLDVVAGKDISDTTRAASGGLLAEAPDGTLYVWSRCPINDCGTFSFVDTPTDGVVRTADLVQVFMQSGGHLMFRKNITAPPDAFDFVYESSGPVVLSAGAGFCALTRTTESGATVLAHFEDEHALTKFVTQGDAHVFVTETSTGGGRLRRADGSLVLEFPLPGTGDIEHASLSPTGDALVVIRGNEAWITSLVDGAVTSTRLPTELTKLTGQTAGDSSFGATWTTSGIALRDQTGAELFARTAPFARKWKTLTRQPNVRGALGVGESVVLLTNGIEILDPNGAIVGGAEPLDVAAIDDAPKLAVVAPNVVALAGRTCSYQFRVDGIPAP